MSSVLHGAHSVSFERNSPVVVIRNVSAKFCDEVIYGFELLSVIRFQSSKEIFLCALAILLLL